MYNKNQHFIGWSFWVWYILPKGKVLNRKICLGSISSILSSQLDTHETRGLPSLFGVSIYAFMCHHRYIDSSEFNLFSLPSLVTPISNKSYLNRLLGADFILIFLVYSLLCASALFAFGSDPNATCSSSPGASCQIQSLYTLNFTSYSKLSL